MGRMRTIYISAVIFIVFLLISCSSEEIDDSQQPLHGSIFFELTETYHDTGEEPVMMFSMATEQFYQYGDTFVLDFDFDKQEITVDIKYIQRYDWGGWNPLMNCAVTFERYLYLEHGEYDLVFTYQDFEGRYKVSISDTTLWISPGVNYFTKPVFEVYWRYPQNTFFCFARPIHSSDSVVYQGFIDTLHSRIDLEVFEFPSYGEVSYLWRVFGGDEIICEYQYDFFHYTSESDFDEAVDALESYTTDVLEPYAAFYLAMVNWKNKNYSTDDFRE